VRTADVLLVIGARLGEMTTGAYTLVEPPRPKQKLVHVHAGAEELGRVYQGELLVIRMPQIAAALKNLKVDGGAGNPGARRARADYLDWTKPAPNPGKVQLAEIVAWLRDRLPADAIIANGAGISPAGFRASIAIRAAHAGRAHQRFDGYGVPAVSRPKSLTLSASSSRSTATATSL